MSKGGIIGGVAVTVVLGFGVARYGPKKQGVIYHDQGKAIKCEQVDTFREAESYAMVIGQVGEDRGFGGSSYHFILIGDWIFRMNEENAISYHASGINTKALGVMMARTDDEEFNKKTAYTVRRLIGDLNAKHNYDFALFHSDVAKNGKEDPHEYRPWLIQMGLRWDARPYPMNVGNASTGPNYYKWVKI